MVLETRVKLPEGFPKKIPVEMGIDLRGGNALMAQHLLDRTQVRSTFHQVGGKTVPKRMGVDVFAEPGA